MIVVPVEEPFDPLQFYIRLAGLHLELLVVLEDPNLLSDSRASVGEVCRVVMAVASAAVLLVAAIFVMVSTVAALSTSSRFVKCFFCFFPVVFYLFICF